MPAQRGRRSAWKASAFVMASLSMLAIAPMPMPAMADTPAEMYQRVTEAKRRRDSLYEEAERASEELNKSQDELDATNESIAATQADTESKQAEIEEAKASLTTQIEGGYKGRTSTLIAILSGASNIPDMVKAVSDTSHVTEATYSDIDDVTELRESLERSKAELQQRQVEQQERVAKLQEDKDALDAKVGESDAYIDSLNDAMRQALSTRDTEENATSASQSPSMADATTVTDASQLSGWRQKVVAMAYSQVGGTYVYGGSDFKATDCSGLTLQCYAAAGVSIPHQSEAQSSFCTKPISQAEIGDVVWKYGHVGIYIGNGKTIEAFNPSRGIGYGTIDRFSRCGSPISDD